MAVIAFTLEPVTGPPAPGTGRFGFVEFDATIREQHQQRSTITDRPVEEDESVVDHIRPMPDKIILEAAVSDTPVIFPPGLFGGIGNRGVLAGKLSQERREYRDRHQSAQLQQPQNIDIPLPGGQVGQIRALKFDTPINRVQEVYDALEYLRLSGTTVSVLTTLKDYESMAIESIDTPRDAQRGSGFVATITLKHVRIVSTELTAAPSLPVKRRKRRGGKSKKPAKTKNKKAALKSILARLARL